MLGVGMYWENYFGKDKDLVEKNQKLIILQQKLVAHELSIISLSGSLLDLIKRGLSMIYGSPEKWPCGKKIGLQCISNIILQSRNQSLHFDEAIRDGNYKNDKINKCFNILKDEVNKVFNDYLKQDMVFEVLKVLGIIDYSSFENVLETLK